MTVDELLAELERIKAWHSAGNWPIDIPDQWGESTEALNVEILPGWQGSPRIYVH